jgi:ABC-type nitrate/sulfonate/bicarbonate transport system ATPase subunit
VTAISVRGVSKRFSRRGVEDVLALSAIDLDVAPLQTVAIVGPSGCGKSTLLNLIAGFASPSEGSIAVNGRPVTGPAADRAVVFQGDAVFPWLSVRRNLTYGPRMRGVPAREYEPRVQRFLQVVGLAGFADAYPKELSGGMRKRVDLARAWINEPDVLLLDEPFGALDVLTKEAMQQALLAIVAEEPKTTLLITHDIEEAVYVADRVIAMSPRPGRLIAELPVPFARPRTPELRADPQFQQLRMRILGLLSRGDDEVAA